MFARPHPTIVYVVCPGETVGAHNGPDGRKDGWGDRPTAEPSSASSQHHHAAAEKEGKHWSRYTLTRARHGRMVFEGILGQI